MSAPTVTGAPTASSARKARAFWPALLGVALVDVATKYVAHTRLRPVHLPRDVVGEWVRLTLAYNPGAAFGLNVGPYSRAFFVVLTTAALWALWRLYQTTAPDDRRRALALGLVVGGALGNLVNRFWSAPGVVDFIDVGVGDHRWPTFNVADIGVSVGACLLAWVFWREDRAGGGARGDSTAGRRATE